MATWDKSLKVGKSDSYSVTVSSDWLDDQSLTGALFVSDDTDIATVGGTDIAGNAIATTIEGVGVGYVTFHVTFNTPTRSDCVVVGLYVEEC